jgi:hypothetical protein
MQHGDRRRLASLVANITATRSKGGGANRSARVPGGKMEGVAKLEVGLEGASWFLKQEVLHDMLIFVPGSSVFVHDLAGDLAEKTAWVVLMLDSGNQVIARIRLLFP